MSGPPDPELGARFYHEIAAAKDLYAITNPNTLRFLLMFMNTFCSGRGCCFISDVPMHAEVLSIINNTKCRPLLEPYLDHEDWTADEITALKVKVRLTE